jgi:hypothetical protein
LRVLEIEEIKSVPSAPVSHPFVERLIGTIRREYVDRYFFGTPRTWRASCAITKCITTRIESIVRSAARPPRYAPAYPQLFQPRLTVTRGGHIAAVCFRLRSPPDLYFATHTIEVVTGGPLQPKLGKQRPRKSRIGPLLVPRIG